MKKVQKEQSEKAQMEWKLAIQVMSGLRKRKQRKIEESLNKLSFLQGFENEPARTIGEP